MIDLGNSSWILLLGGVAIFMYGMTLASQSLEKLLAARISRLLNQLSDNRFLAIVVGVSLTTLLQSSGAVTSMLVGLGSARVISLRQVMGVIIGSAIGSTLTVQIMSLNLSQYALPLIAVSFLVFFLAQRPGVKNTMLVGMGFGFLFLGLGFISTAAHVFAKDPLIASWILSIKNNPMISFAVAAAFCAFVHSSAVTIGLAMSLAQADAIGVEQALYWVYGANVGTTSTALLAAIGGNYIARQVAWAHFFYKFLSALIFAIPWVNSLLHNWLMQFDTSPFRNIANAHLWFNLISAALFYPFIKPGAALIEKLFPKDPSEEFGSEYLKLNNYQSTALAASYAQREIDRTADIVQSMINDSLALFESPNPALIASIKDRDNKVDFLYRETKMFLLDHANKSAAGVNQNIMSMIMFLSDLERAADAIDINIVQLATKKNTLKLEFSNEGWLEIQEMHKNLVKAASLAINSFKSREMCELAIQEKRKMSQLEVIYREHHIERLNQGRRETINTSSIHLDLLSEFRRIASLLCSHAYKRGTDPAYFP